MISKHSISNTGCLLAFLLAVVVSAAQNNSNPEPKSNRVYVVDFEEVTSETESTVPDTSSVKSRDIAQLTTAIIRLRLQEMPSLEIIATDKERFCGGQAGPSESPAKTPMNGPLQTQHGAKAIIEPAGAEFLQIRGSVETHPPNITVNYWLEHCDGRVLRRMDADRAVLIADRSSFLADAALGQISAISQFFTDKLENRPLTVAVSQFTGGEKIAANLTSYLKQLLTTMPAFELSDAATNPSYIIDGDLTTSGAEIYAKIRIHSSDGGSAPVVEVRGASTLQWEFQRKAASATFATLNDLRVTRQYGWDSLSNTSFEKLMEEGKHLLCLNQPASCRQDPWAAVRVFEVAAKNPKATWSASYYLGVAQAANYKYDDAGKSFMQALSQISASIPKGPEANQARVQVLNSAGDLGLRSGNVESGILQYQESLKIDPEQPQIYVKRAEALFVQKRPEAMKVLLDGIRRTPTVPELHSAVMENLRKLQDGDFKAVEQEFQRASTDHVPIDDEYALLWVLWAETGSINADPVKQRQYVSNALALHSTDIGVQAQAYALRAAIDIPADLDEVEKYLAQAEALAAEKIDRTTLAWMARLRTLYWLDRKDYATAAKWAEKARGIDAGSASELLSADVAANWAKSLVERNSRDEQATKLFTKARDQILPLVESRYEGADSIFYTANHALGLDQDSKRLFKRIVEKNPKDFSATLSLAFVCSEFLFDTACSYAQNRKLLDLDMGALSPADRAAMKLNAAEAAVLQREYQQASVWLNELALSELGADYAAIVDFYKIWIAFARKQADSRSDFDQLRQALAAYADLQKKGGAQLSSWSFQGARHALARSDLPSQKQRLLADVIAVIEDPSKNLAAIQFPEI